MGVHGLWRLIEPSGKPVPLETLENKILAVDVSIWLHQSVKGFQDARGDSLPNAHLLGIYHRICKLLYFRIRPVFVFDGGVPALKKNTIDKRNQLKHKHLNEAKDIQAKIKKSLLKYTAVNEVISEKTNSTTKAKKQKNENDKDDIFKLPEPPLELNNTLDSYSSSDDEESEFTDSSPTKQWDFYTIDEKSEHFKSLPADVRHEILTDLKETRKQSSWGRIHELPKESGDFSSFQMKRLLKRYSVQASLEEAEKEMGGHSLSLGELEALLTEEGIVTTSKNIATNKIASDENTRYLLIKDLQKAIERSKEQEKLKEQDALRTIKESDEPSIDNEVPLINETSTKNEEFEKELATAIQLSLQDQPSTSKDTESTQKEFSYLENFNDGDFESDHETDEETNLPVLEQAKQYMVEYSGLTPSEITKILESKTKRAKIPKKQVISTITAKDVIIQNNPNNKNTLIDITNDTIETNNTSDIEPRIKVPENTKIFSDIVVTKITENKDEIKECAEEVIKVANEDNNRLSEPDEADFIEVPEGSNNKNKEINNAINEKLDDSQSIEIMSDSDDSDFLEVNDSKTKHEAKSALEIVINPKSELKDDLFSDIFLENNTSNKETHTLIAEKVPDTNLSTIEEKDEDINIDNTVKYQEIIDSELTDDKDESKIEVENTEVNDKVEVIHLPKRNLTVEELNDMKTSLQVEQANLLSERKNKERMAKNITDQMYQEAQELLELFGLPYVIAPMEAEAQCAFLNDINLTDGTITDDSDIWLFGGKTVYRNFFNQKKHVLEFRAENIEHHFKLTREQLILLALLVGSDYTLGIQGIGPVTALEILASFPPSQNTDISVLTQNDLISGLAEFRNWLLEGKAVGVGRTSLRSKLQNVQLNEGFPSIQVVQAYLQPKVETCADSFSWGKPDIVALIDFAKEKFGWTRLKSEEILKPVIKKLENNSIQKSIKDYFATKHKIDSDSVEMKMSKRVKTAVHKMGKKHQEVDNEESNTKSTKTNEESSAKTAKTRKKAPRKTKDSESEKTVSKPKPRTRKTTELHEKEVIPQRERDKIDALKSKLKAIEVFRKSKQGPGFVKRRQKAVKELKEEAELSESSSD